MPTPAPIRIRIVRVNESHDDVPLPAYATEGSSGMDIHAAVEGELNLNPQETVLVPTGFRVEIPHGYEGQVRPRSGLAIKHGIGILNSPGTIDADFRGEVKIILTNFGRNPYVIRRGDRVAQLVIAPVSRIAWDIDEKLSDTVRGEGGFGHSGS